MPVLAAAVLPYQIIPYLNPSLSFFVTGSMSDESLPNNLDARIEAAVQHALSKLDLRPRQQSATSAGKLFKPADIGFFDPGQDVEDDKLWTQNVFIFIQRIKNV